jgi:hypothetical protein
VAEEGERKTGRKKERLGNRVWVMLFLQNVE